MSRVEGVLLLTTAIAQARKQNLHLGKAEGSFVTMGEFTQGLQQLPNQPYVAGNQSAVRTPA